MAGDIQPLIGMCDGEQINQAGDPILNFMIVALRTKSAGFDAKLPGE